MFTISKAFKFSAAHAALQLPEGDPCRNIHGHNYLVEVVMQSPTLDRYGMVVNYHDLKPFKEYLDGVFDHHFLNEVIPVDKDDVGGIPITTAESLAYHFYEWCHGQWPETVAVIVRETPDTFACYSPGVLPGWGVFRK